MDLQKSRNVLLKQERPTIKFIGFTNDEPWEMLSLRERLRTVEEALQTQSRNWARSVDAYQGLQRELDKLKEEFLELQKENYCLRKLGKQAEELEVSEAEDDQASNHQSNDSKNLVDEPIEENQ